MYTGSYWNAAAVIADDFINTITEGRDFNALVEKALPIGTWALFQAALPEQSALIAIPLAACSVAYNMYNLYNDYTSDNINTADDIGHNHTNF